MNRVSAVSHEHQWEESIGPAMAHIVTGPTSDGHQVSYFLFVCGECKGVQPRYLEDFQRTTLTHQIDLRRAIEDRGFHLVL